MVGSEELGGPMEGAAAGEQASAVSGATEVVEGPITTAAPDLEGEASDNSSMASSDASDPLGRALEAAGLDMSMPE